MLAELFCSYLSTTSEVKHDHLILKPLYIPLLTFVIMQVT